MKICDWYKTCLSMQPKTDVRVYYDGHCIYWGSYGSMSYVVAHMNFDSCIIDPSDFTWKFYVTD